MKHGKEMLHCHEVIAQLWGYIDGDLTAERAEQIREHLDMCSRCFPLYDFHRAFLAFLSQVGQRPLPPLLRRRIFQRLLEEEAGGTVA
ncbi:MAG: zf-HC2 domain-containing protein [Gemmatimonadota bacterium]